MYFAYSVGFMVPEDYSSGYIKNILRADPSRKGFIFSKLLIISLFVIFVTAMFALILLLAHIIFMPDFYFGSFANFATAFGLQSILTITLASVVMMIGSFFRKSVYTLIFSTFLCTGTVESGLYTINLLQNKIWAKEYFDFTKLGLYEAVSNRPELKANIVYLLALCTVYLFLSQIISVYLIRNKDIK
ncbi:MAG: ABC transporter permease [Bacillota bacterium]|nr:ABC transporter permease [Bacillota bacterium]